MKLHQIRYALAVVTTGSFTRAAELCNVTQPTLSRAVRELETAFGGPLFARGTGGARVTDLGRIVMPHLEQIAGEAQRAREAAAVLHEAQRRSLRLGLMCTVPVGRVAPVLAAAAEAAPGFALDLRDGTAADLAAAVRAGDLDAAILAEPEPPADLLHRIPLYRERMVIAAAPADPLAARGTIEPAEFAARPYLSRSRCEFGDFSRRVWAGLGCEPRILHRSDRDDAILALVAAGIGVALAPEDLARAAGLACLRLDAPPRERAVVLALSPADPAPAALGALVRAAVAAFPDPDRPAPVQEPAESTRA